jgi:predicted site-specific integrase-resolvase
MAIEHGGVSHLTIADARAHFGVSEKTIYGWIEKGIVPVPPTINRGVQTLYVFDEEYFVQADAAVAAYRESRKRGNK